MNRPTMSNRTTGIKSRQKYAFLDQQEKQVQVMEIAMEDVRFHELLAKLNLKVIINTDWRVRFARIDTTIPKMALGVVYSRICKLVWDNYRPLCDDYGLQLINMHTGGVAA